MLHCSAFVFRCVVPHVKVSRRPVSASRPAELTSNSGISFFFFYGGRRGGADGWEGGKRTPKLPDRTFTLHVSIFHFCVVIPLMVCVCSGSCFVLISALFGSGYSWNLNLHAVVRGDMEVGRGRFVSLIALSLHSVTLYKLSWPWGNITTHSGTIAVNHSRLRSRVSLHSRHFLL